MSFLKKKYQEQINFIFILFMMISLSLVLNSIGINKENNILLYIIGVLLIATITHGYFYGIIASIVSVLCYNYFFTLPIYNFHMSDPSDVMLLCFFVITSLIGCNLTNRFQRQLVISHLNEQLTESLYQLSSRLLNISTVEKIIEEGNEFIKEHIQVDAVISLDKIEHYYHEFPIRISDNDLGYVYVIEDRKLKESDLMMLQAVANQLSYSLEREYTYQNQEKIKVEMEKEHMTNSMLRSISHDLRTPLTGIVGASSLIFEKNIDQSTNLLAKDIYEQAKWLSQLVENILNMSKIENESLILNKNFEVIDDLIQEAISLRPELENRNLILKLPNELFFLNVDGKMIIQVLINLLDNAIKYTNSNDSITIEVIKDHQEAIVSIRDTGIGIHESISNNLFDEFTTYPGVSQDSHKGIGLGLAICKAIIHLHGGKIQAGNNEDGGAFVSFTLPIESEVVIDE